MGSGIITKESLILDLEGLAKLANSFSSKLKKGSILFLRGSLGAGKTTFTRLLLESLGYRGVSSPTYTISNEYETDKFKVLHIDAYRLKENEGLEYLLEEAEDKVLIVEWPNSSFPKPDYEIEFHYVKDKNKRGANVISY